jgi:hypothetical protein
LSDAVTTLAQGGLDRIYDTIEASLPGVLHPIVQMTLWASIEEFCIKSTYWRQWVNWQMAAGVTRVDLNPIDTNTRAHWVLEACGLSCWRLSPPAILVDTGVADKARSGTALAVCKPTKLAAALPSFLVDDWSEALQAGVLYRLYSQPAKPYSNPQMALFYGKQFRYEVNRAREAVRHLVHCRPPPFPYFASGRQGFVGAWCECPAPETTPVVPPVSITPVLTVSAGVITDALASGPLVSISAPVITDAPSGPVVSLSASSLSFPAEPLTTASPDETITIINTGNAPLTVTAASATGDFAVTGLTSG